MLRPGSFAMTLLLAMLTGLGPLSVDMYLASMPDIGRLLGAPTAQVQLTISFYLVGFALGQMFYGPLSDRHGRRPVMLVALGGLSRSRRWPARWRRRSRLLIAARFCQAIGGAGTIVLARAVVRDLYEGARVGRELSLHGLDHGAGADRGAAARRRAADRVRLALEFRAAARLRRCWPATMVWLLLPETLRQRAPEPVSLALDLALLSPLSRRRELRRPSRHRHLLPVRTVRLDFQRRLRAAGHLRPVRARLRH